MKKILVLALTFLVCLAACGTQNNESKQNVSDKETMIYTDAKNDKVEIPKNPKRIAMLNFHYVGNFIKLDKKPILINEFAKESDVIKNATQGIETVGNDDVEKVASAKPDLIITYSSDPNFKKYTKIAPTLALDVGGDMDFKEALKIQAKMVGKEDKANRQR
ncbi:ABC transporter substrate-binding protein [Staphylococcus felis]|uniref:ABC transporter substrate-binding protein n=1 Tax=Staphylococcus felis TaxID=46127 RepID=UPI0015F28F92|nr:ABC transporter substrate-binding protein [Staphylococcus felis]